MATTDASPRSRFRTFAVFDGVQSSTRCIDGWFRRTSQDGVITAKLLRMRVRLIGDVDGHNPTRQQSSARLNVVL